MRTKHSVKNISVSIVSQLIIVVLGFISRKVFLDSLGVDYLGINGLLTNVLAMLGLVESGIGLSIVYNLYKPLAENDRDKVIALVQLFKRAYAVLAVIIFALSLALYPVLSYLMKNGQSISDLTVIYFIFVAKNMVSYLNAHKWSLLNADQKGYVLARINLAFQVLTTIVKIIVLIATRNYILYLALELVIYLLQSIVNGKIVNNKYPYIKTKDKYVCDAGTRSNIVDNIKALFLHNIGGYFVFGTDNLLISSFISVAAVGLYSNYTMIIGQLSAFAAPVIDGIGASVGNLIATEDNHKQYTVFRTAFLLNFWIYALCSISLYNLLQPFISWWIGSEYLLDHLAFVVILIHFYLTGSRASIGTFKSKAGLFLQDKYVPLLEAGINLAASLIFLKWFGLAGVLLGTIVSTLMTVYWTQPYIVYKHLFKLPVRTYFMNFTFYACLTAVACFLTTTLCNLVAVDHRLLSLVIRGIVCLIVPNLLFVTVFYKRREFQYIKNVAGALFAELYRKWTPKKETAQG